MRLLLQIRVMRLENKRVFQSKLFVSPAKLNVFFCVLGKYVGGLHEVYSVMSTLDFYDTISLCPSSNDQFLCNNSIVRDDSKNLVIKARDLWRRETGIFEPLKIELIKNIPLGSGLAGGSSNAATILWALNEIFNFPLSVEKLKQLATQLGSDVPFFFSSGLALVTRNGHEVRDLEIPFNNKIELFMSPDIHSCTKDVFSRLKTFSALLTAQKLLTKFLHLEPVCQNDLLKSALSLYPNLKLRYDSLKDLGVRVCLTGSGSTLFTIDSKQVLEHEKGFTRKCVSSIKRQLTSWY